MPATFSIQLVANPTGVKSGARDATAALDGVKAKALEVNAAMRTIFGVYAIKELISGLYEMADSYTTLQNKLRNVATDQDNLNGISERTFAIAQRSRSSWETTATLYSRMARAAKGLGTSQEELLGFTERLNKATIISGATTMEARNGLIQLSQGMASGKLHGQDLRAVLEDIPYVADVIAKHFHVTRGELRDLGKEGKISGKDIIVAFKEADEQIQREFGNTIPTMAQSFVMLKNAATKFFGEAGTGSGVLSGLANAIKFVSEHFDTFGKVIISVLEEIVGFFVIYEVIKILKALWVVVAANPLIALVALLVQGVLLLRQFGDQLMTHTKVWTNVDGVFVSVGDHLTALWDVVKKLGDALGGAFLEAWNAISQLFGGDGIDTSKTEDALASMIDTIAKWVITLTVIIRHVKDIFYDIFAGVPIVLAAKFDEAFSGVLDAILKVVNVIINTINKLANVGKTIGGLTHISDRQNASAQRDQFTKEIADANKQLTEYRNLTQTIDYTKLGPGGGQGLKTVLPTSAAYKAQEDALEKHVLALKAKRQMAQDTIDELDASYGAKAQITVLPNLEADHAGLQKAGQEARAKMHDDSVQTLAEIKKETDAYAVAVHDAATKRAMARKKDGGTVGDETGDDITKGGAKLKNNGFDAFLKQLEALAKRSNDVTEAQLKMKDANDLLDKSLADNKNILGGGAGKKYTGAELVQKLFGVSAGDLMTELEKTLRPNLDPFGFWIDETIKKTAAMKGSGEEEKRYQEIVAVTQSLEKKGLTLTLAQRDEIEKVTAAQQHRLAIWEEEKKILADVQGATEKYRNQLEAFYNLVGQNKLSAQEAGRVFQDITNAYVHSNDASYEIWRNKMSKIDPFGSGWTNSIQKMQDDLLNVSRAVENVVTTAFTNVQSFIVDSAMHGKIEWESLIKDMEKALDELAFKILANGIIDKLMGTNDPKKLIGNQVGDAVSASATGAATGTSASATMLAAAPAIGAAIGASAALAMTATRAGEDSLNKVISAASAAIGGGGTVTMADGTQMPGIVDPWSHANGGRFVVPGSGGPDTKNVMFRLSPGEQVDFTPPGQLGPQAVNRTDVPIQNPNGSNGRPTPAERTRPIVIQNKIVHQYDRRELLAAVNTNDGRSTVADVVRSMPGLRRK